MTAVIRLHHVQVSCPVGGEDAARRFYAEGLGLTEVEKPAPLRGRGGAWFRAYDRGRVAAEIHVGVDDQCVTAGQAHPAFVVPELDRVASALMGLGFEVDRSERDTFDGYLRFHSHDPAGNRVEVLQPRD
jgi:catechol 2,3-dioxygenase-like lactoylglutathione lyase family enzyme